MNIQLLCTYDDVSSSHMSHTMDAVINRVINSPTPWLPCLVQCFLGDVFGKARIFGSRPTLPLRHDFNCLAIRGDLQPGRTMSTRVGLRGCPRWLAGEVAFRPMLNADKVDFRKVWDLNQALSAQRCLETSCSSFL